MALKIYERHLAREIYAATGLVLLAFLMLFAFFDLIHQLESIGKGGYQIQHALGYVALTLPGRLYELFPIGVLIGTLYALTVLARHSEITVLRAAGLSTGDLLLTLAKIGTVFVVLTLLMGELVAPPAERAAQQLRLRAMGSMVAQEFRSGLWVKDERSFVNVREVLPDASLQNVRIFEFDDRFQLLSISQAERGSYLRDGNWLLDGVVRTVFSGEAAHVERFRELNWKSGLSPDLLAVLMVVPERMSLVNLYLFVRHLSGNQQKTDRYDIAMWKKLIYPLAALVMMALALPFAYMQDRMGTVSIRVFAGIMLGIGFHMLNGLFSSLGVINSWPPFFSAITPSVLFLVTAAGMLWWVERR
ncbi:MAG: LPS export ABC transporter permease LptG [Betaproteobacteria bacterium]|nr:LPS export ABC transporter permease LptG [Betaproteobacteria bacterium]